MNRKLVFVSLVFLLLAVSLPACGAPSPAASGNSEAAAALSQTLDPQTNPQTSESTPSLGNRPDLLPVPDRNGDGVIDICEAVPAEIWEKVMGRAIVGEPAPFQDDHLGNGCAFDFGSDGSAAFFAYASFASEGQFEASLASAVQPEPVSTLGDSAFLQNGPDARQLWVRSGDQAVMVAIGDTANDAGMLRVAPYLIQALP